MASEPEFQQAYGELVASLESSTIFSKSPEFRTALRVVAEPEKVVQFRVVWDDDQGRVQVNRGYRLHYNTALGPCKGGIRFHPSVNLSVLKFLGLAQVFKNALTGLSLGGAKGGADFDPKGKSENEIRRFCQAFMVELKSHIGASLDVPGGDIGVSEKEIGWLFGHYKTLCKSSEGVLTGKGISWGGSHGRKEAAGFGVAYYVEQMIKHRTEGRESLKGKRIAVSGSGNVATHAAIKAIQLGATVVSLSDSGGSFVASAANNNGSSITSELVQRVMELKTKRGRLEDLAGEQPLPGVTYLAGERPWKHLAQVDVVLPCATQNEVSGDEAQALINAGCKYVAEGSNMGCTAAASALFEAHRRKHGKEAVWYAPGKAANAGGVAVSGLELSQNSSRETWKPEEVDARLRSIMQACFESGLAAAQEYGKMGAGELPSLVDGTNIAGFIIVVKAMHDQGHWW